MVYRSEISAIERLGRVTYWAGPGCIGLRTVSKPACQGSVRWHPDHARPCHPGRKRSTVGVCHRRVSGAPAFTVIFIFASHSVDAGIVANDAEEAMYCGIKTRTATALPASIVTNSTFRRDKLRQQNISGRSQFTTGTPT